MSRLTRLLNQCGGKVRHAARRDAEKAREQSERSFGQSMHPYYCELCKGWHLARGKREQ